MHKETLNYVGGEEDGELTLCFDAGNVAELMCDVRILLQIDAKMMTRRSVPSVRLGEVT